MFDNSQMCHLCKHDSKVRVIIRNSFMSASFASSSNFYLILYKVKHLIFEDDYKRSHELFLNKYYALEYYVTKEDKFTLKMNFMQAF